jgi:hypothetical protein
MDAMRDKTSAKARLDLDSVNQRSRVAFAFVDLSRYLQRYLVVLRAATSKP